MHLPAAILFGTLLVPASGRVTSPLPWSCDVIRYYASKLTQIEIDFLARRFRLTAEQKAEALRCLRKEDKS